MIEFQSHNLHPEPPETKRTQKGGMRTRINAFSDNNAFREAFTKE